MAKRIAMFGIIVSLIGLSPMFVVGGNSREDVRSDSAAERCAKWGCPNQGGLVCSYCKKLFCDVDVTYSDCRICTLWCFDHKDMHPHPPIGVAETPEDVERH